MRKKFSLLTLLLLTAVSSAWATGVNVTLNAITRSITIAEKATGNAVDMPEAGGTATARTYELSLGVGTYILTGYAADGTTVNGTLEFTVGSQTVDLVIRTITAYASNSGWTVGTDYDVIHSCATREGEPIIGTQGTLGGTSATTKDRHTFLILNGGSYQVQLVPSAAHQAEGYLTANLTNTVTANVNAYAAIPMGYAYTVKAPKAATFFLGRKTSHFVPFIEVPYEERTEEGDSYVYHYTLANNQQYNYRAEAPGKLTQSGIFTMSAALSEIPLVITDAEFSAHDPQAYVHDVTANGGYETGDIFLNINERGHLKLAAGQTYDLLAMRTWEIINTTMANYFIEPNFHYTVVNLGGEAEGSVVELDRSVTDSNPWVTLTARGKGTALVLVTYDGLVANSLSTAGAKDGFAGGSYWGAIWPENTGVFVVSVGDGESGITTGMTINAGKNKVTEKVAGDAIDAECDVLYYLDTEDGIDYTFIPSGVADVAVAYPAIGEGCVTYGAFTATGVTKSGDAYTVRLHRGRNIVRLTAANGVSEYQVITARPAHREVTNLTRPGSTVFQPGDQVKVQYSGLFHPANKLSGIHNFSAFVDYNGKPNGESLILGSNQYTFGSAPAAQAVTVTIDDDWDVSANPVFTLSEGILRISGFGDPVGNHRVIQKATGRNANFTAVAHTTYFGSVPDVNITLTPVQNFRIITHPAVEGTRITIVSATGKTLAENADGSFTGTYGTYTYTAEAAGYKVSRGTFTIHEGDPEDVNVDIVQSPIPAGGWDGTSTAEPALAGGVYQIGTGAELAWFAARVGAGNNKTIKGRLTADIDLGGFPWTRIGNNTTAYQYTGTFDGDGHTVSGLYINATTTYQGLFGYLGSGGEVKNLTVEGEVTSNQNYVGGIAGYITAAKLTRCVNRVRVSGKQYVGGLTGYAGGASTLSQCGNEASVTGSGTYVGGITGYLFAATGAIRDSYNTGAIHGSNYVAGIAPFSNAASTYDNVFNTGLITADVNTYVGAIRAASSNATKITNAYAIHNYEQTAAYAEEHTAQDFADGTVLALLQQVSPDVWAQTLGTDATPRFTTSVRLLDGVAYTGSADRQVDEVAYTRTFSNTNWQALYLPFELAVADIAENFDVARLNDTYQYDDDEDGTIDRSELEVIYQRAGTIKAHTPYMIRAKEVGEYTLSATGVTLRAAEQRSINCTSVNTTFTFTGTYTGVSGEEMFTGKYFALGGGRLAQASSANVSLAPYRWYLSVTDRDGNQKALNEVKFFFFEEGEDTTTAVDRVDAGTNRLQPCYDLSGRPVAREAEALKPGIYIIAGRKVLVK